VANIEEVRSGIGQATDKASESLGALQQAQDAIEQAQSALAQVTEGSSQSDVDQANAYFAEAASKIGDVQQAVNAAIEAAEGVSARL
jgi:ABC-type transporter Mla subunit MlaD